MQNYQPQIFNLHDKENWKKYLDEEGYVVISNILGTQEKEKAFRLFQEDWISVSPNFDFNNHKTWDIEHTPMMYGKGIAVFNGFGQSNFMWDLRLNKNIIDIFKYIHTTDELVVSLDGFSVFVSHKQKSASWLHIDQNPNNLIYSIQGSYNFFPVNEYDAGFQVMPKSHITYCPEVTHNKNWISCKDKDLENQSVKLIIPDNCFTLWNSRLIQHRHEKKRSYRNNGN